MRAAGPVQGQRVVGSLETQSIAHLIGGNHVQTLALQFVLRVARHVVRFRRKSDQERVQRFCAERLARMSGFSSSCRARPAPSCFFNLCASGCGRAIIAHRRRTNIDVGLGSGGQHRRVHLRGTAHIDTLRARRPGVASCTGPATKVTVAPASAAACATAKPMRPELRLPMKRTGSMSS